MPLPSCTDKFIMALPGAEEHLMWCVGDNSSCRDAETGQGLFKWVPATHPSCEALRALLPPPKESLLRRLINSVQNNGRGHGHASECTHVLGGMRTTEQSRPNAARPRPQNVPNSSGDVWRCDYGYGREKLTACVCVVRGGGWGAADLVLYLIAVHCKHSSVISIPCSAHHHPHLCPLAPSPSGTRYMRTGANSVVCVVLEAMMYMLTFGAVMAGTVVAHLEFVNQNFGTYGKGGYVCFFNCKRDLNLNVYSYAFLCIRCGFSLERGETCLFRSTIISHKPQDTY